MLIPSHYERPFDSKTLHELICPLCMGNSNYVVREGTQANFFCRHTRTIVHVHPKCRKMDVVSGVEPSQYEGVKELAKYVFERQKKLN